VYEGCENVYVCAYSRIVYMYMANVGVFWKRRKER